MEFDQPSVSAPRTDSNLNRRCGLNVMCSVERAMRFAILIDDHISHAHALTGVARRLRSAGHRVCFFGPGGTALAVAEEGFEYVALPFLSPAVVPSTTQPTFRSKMEAEAAVAARATASLEGARELAAEYAPDLAVFDPFLLCHYPSFARLGIRSVAVSTKPLLTPDPLVPPYTSGFVPPVDGGRSMGVALAWLRQRLYYQSYRSACRAVEWRRGWSHRSLTLAIARATGFAMRDEWATRPLAYDLRFRSVPELVLHARQFDLPRQHPLSGVGAFVGPCTDLPAEPPIKPVPPGTGPLLYCHLGSVSQQHDRRTLSSYRAILEALRLNTTWRAVIVTASPRISQSLQVAATSLGERVVVRDWAPRAAYLTHANLVVTHGGANSVKEAILAGLPILALPRRADQPGIAARIVFHQLGLAAKPGAPGIVIAALLARLLAEPAFGARVRTMRDHFRRYDAQRVCERIFTGAAAGCVPTFATAGI